MLWKWTLFVRSHFNYNYIIIPLNMITLYRVVTIFVELSARFIRIYIDDVSIFPVLSPSQYPRVGNHFNILTLLQLKFQYLYLSWRLLK